MLFFLAFLVVVFSHSFFSANGYLSPDSTRYLALAQNLIEGNGFSVSSVSLDGNDREYFAIWPLGYPVLIAMLAKVSGLSVFISSKIINLIFIALSLWIIRKMFKVDSHVFGCVLLFGAFLQLFSHSWSEVPFIFGLLWLCFSLNGYLNGTLKYSLIHLLFAGVLIFLSRYIGAFSFVVVGLVALWQLKQRRLANFVHLSLVSLVGFIFVVSYLYNNVLETGWVTGKQRIPSFETNLQLAVMVVKAFSQELVVLSGHNKTTFFWMLVIQMSVIAVVWFNIKPSTILSNNNYSVDEKKGRNLQFVLFLVGVTYLVAIVLSRWFTQFDYLNYRLLAPGTLLLLLAMILKIQRSNSVLLYLRVRRIVFLLAFISVIINSLMPLVKYQVESKSLSYQQNILEIEENYKSIPNESIVVFADNHIRYIRTSLILARPNFIPFAKYNEAVESFLLRIKTNYPNKEIFIVTDQKKVSCKRLHSSWCELLQQNSQNRFYQIQ